MGDGIVKYTLEEAKKRFGKRYYILYDLMGNEIVTLPGDPVKINDIVKEKFRAYLEEEAREVSPLLSSSVNVWVNMFVDGMDDVISFSGDPVLFAKRIVDKLRRKRGELIEAIRRLKSGDARVEDVASIAGEMGTLEEIIGMIDPDFRSLLREEYDTTVNAALERGRTPPSFEEYVVKNPRIRDRVAYRIAWFINSIFPAVIITDDPISCREPLVLWHGLVTGYSQLELADTILEALLGDSYDTRLKKTVHEKLRDMALRISRLQLNKAMLGRLPMGDRVLDLETLEYEKIGFYRPKQIFSIRLSWMLDPNFIEKLKTDKITMSYFEKNAPNFTRLLKLLFDDENLPRFMEAIGKLPETRIQSRLIALIVGDKGIGKSTLMDIIRKAMGSNVISNKSLEELASGKWIGELEGKLAVISSEEPEGVLTNIGVLKRITGEPELTGDVKFRRSKEFPNYIKLYFTMNKVPQFRKIDEALLDRFYIILAQNHQHRHEIPDLYTRIVKEELDAVREFIFYCYWQNRKSGVDRKYDMSTEEKYQLLLMSESNVYKFLKDRDYIEEDEDAIVERKELYGAYLEWCNEHMEKPIGRNTFYEKIRGLGYREVWLGNKRCFKGIRIKNKPSQSTLSSI